MDMSLHQSVGQYEGLEQERRNSIANALELCLSCSNPSSRSPALPFSQTNLKLRLIMPMTWLCLQEKEVSCPFWAVTFITEGHRRYTSSIQRYSNRACQLLAIAGTTIRWYPAKRALSAMHKHDGWGPFGRIPSYSGMLSSLSNHCKSFEEQLPR